MRLPLLLAALLSACVCPAYADEAWRLFVADHADGKVTAIDLATNSTAGTFELAAPASLYTTPSKRAVYAVQGSANQVALISSGIAVSDHGDHGDLEVAAPALSDALVEGEKPVHFVEHDGHIAIFFDGEGKAKMLRESAWLAGNAATSELTVSAPHHGVAAALGDHVLASRAHPQDPSELPVGIDVFGPDGKLVGDLHECPDLHGEASSGDTLAIACGTGLLLVTEGSTPPDIAFLPYDKSLPEGKTTTLLGGVGLQYWLGNWGADKVAIIDPSATPAFRIVNLPSRRVHFAIDPEAVKFAYVFTEDGDLQRINVLSGAIDKTVKVTEPYSMDGEWSLPRPRIAVAGKQIVVTDPLKGMVHLVDAGTFELAGELQVSGSPFNVVAVGGTGVGH